MSELPNSLNPIREG